MSRAADLDALGFGPKDDPTPAELKARWHELALDHHPDRGGDASAFAELTGPYERLKKVAMAPRRCEPCAGRGFKVKVTPLGPVKAKCPKCGGKGKVSRGDR